MRSSEISLWAIAHHFKFLIEGLSECHSSKVVFKYFSKHTRLHRLVLNFFRGVSAAYQKVFP